MFYLIRFSLVFLYLFIYFLNIIEKRIGLKWKQQMLSLHYWILEQRRIKRKMIVMYKFHVLLAFFYFLQLCDANQYFFLSFLLFDYLGTHQQADKRRNSPCLFLGGHKEGKSRESKTGKVFSTSIYVFFFPKTFFFSPPPSLSLSSVWN